MEAQAGQMEAKEGTGEKNEERANHWISTGRLMKNQYFGPAGGLKLGTRVLGWGFGGWTCAHFCFRIEHVGSREATWSSLSTKWGLKFLRHKTRMG